jgi:G3E family GTPase
MTQLSLVFGGSHAAREQAIAVAAAKGARSTAIIEGMPSGEATLDDMPVDAGFEIFRVAAGCPCCHGNLTMRVTLNRALRRRPDHLYLSLSNATHKSQVLSFLQEPQYLSLLEIGPEIDCS